MLASPGPVKPNDLGHGRGKTYERDFSPAGRGQGPWCESERGSTLKQTEAGLYRQMEVITMAVAAILLGACAVALVFLAIFFVVGLGWFISSSL